MTVKEDDIRSIVEYLENIKIRANHLWEQGEKQAAYDDLEFAIERSKAKLISLRMKSTPSIILNVQEECLHQLDLWKKNMKSTAVTMKGNRYTQFAHALQFTSEKDESSDQCKCIIM